MVVCSVGGGERSLLLLLWVVCEVFVVSEMAMHRLKLSVLMSNSPYLSALESKRNKNWSFSFLEEKYFGVSNRK